MEHRLVDQWESWESSCHGHGSQREENRSMYLVMVGVVRGRAAAVSDGYENLCPGSDGSRSMENATRPADVVVQCSDTLLTG
ncbi:hypothetical protein Ancab_001475 [Ancistrocladus abbreviatus]